MRQFLQYLLMGALLLIGNSVFAESEVTFQAGDFTAATSSDYSLTKEGVTVAVAGSTVTADEMRIFKNKTITISSTVGNITKVVFNCTASGDAKYGPGCFDDATAGTYSYDDKVGTWVGNAAEFSLTAKTNQVRVTSFVVTIGGTTDTRTATIIQFAEGYQTQIAKGPDDMFPEIGSSVALPTATVMADSAAVAGANVEWSLEVKSWKSKSEGEQPILNNGRISFEGYGVVDVKATYSGNDTYQASSKSYTLTVYNSYGKLSEMVNDVVDINGDKDDEDDRGGSPVFYFFRDIDANGFPPLLNTVTYANGIYIYLTDGEGNNLLFYGNNTQNLKQGDKISGNVGEANLGGFWGNLKRYNKLPEFAFTDMNVKVESEGNAVVPTTITVDKLAENINAYVKMENAQFVSVDKKSLVFKVDETELAVYNQYGVDIDSLEVGATYTLTGMGAIFNTAKQLYLIEYAKTGDAVIIDPQPVDTVHIANTAETAYTIAEAIRLIEAGQALDEIVFVKGFISQIDKYNEKYGSITYWISLDGTTESLHLECYNGMGLEGASFATVDDIEIGAEVIVKGQLKKYNDIYEFNQNNELVSYKAPEATVIIDPNAKGQQNNPYLITDEEFLEMVMNLDTEGSPLSDVIYVKGYITNIDEVSPDYGNARFKIAAVKDKDAEIKLSVYRARYLDNSNFTAEDQIGIFDEVVICGQIKWFNGSPEFVQGCYVYSQQKDSTTVIVNPQPTEPQITHTWDFTKWSEATIANLKADAAASKLTGWSDVEKRADAEADADPTEAAKDNCFWLTDAEGGELTANGVVIEELKGLLFDANYTARRYMAIAVNYPSTSLGDYNGVSYLWLGSKSIECFTIPAVKAGSIIKMGVESHKNTDARGVKLLVNGIELTDPEGNAVAAPTAYTEQTWQVPAGDSPVDIVVMNTNGCHIYFIDAEQETKTPETSYTFEWVAAEQGYENATEIDTVNIDENIKAVFDKNTNANTPKYYTSGTAVRIYGGNTFTVFGEKVAISKIELTFGAGDKSEYYKIITDRGTYSEGIWTSAENVNTNIVKFTVDGTSGNRRIAAIKVTYTIDENAAPLPQPVQIANTAETAYTVAQAIELIEAGEALSDTVFVKGVVSQVDKFDETNKYITYWISADGTTEGAQLECYRGKGIDGADFVSVDDVEVGAEVIVKGQLKKYNDIYEFNNQNELVSYKAPTIDPEPQAGLNDIAFSLNEGGKINPVTGKITVTFPNVTGVEDPTATNFVLAGAFNDMEFDGIEGSFASGATFYLEEFELEPNSDYTLSITSVKVGGVEMAVEGGYKLNFKTRGTERRMSWMFEMDEESAAQIVTEGYANVAGSEYEDITKYMDIQKNGATTHRFYVPARDNEEIMLPDGTALPMTEDLLFKFGTKVFYVGDTEGSYKGVIAFNGKNQYMTIPNCQKGDIIIFNANRATKGSASKPTCIQAMDGAAIAYDGLLSSTGLQDSIWLGSSYANFKFEVQTDGDVRFCINNCLMKSITIEEGVENVPRKYNIVAEYTEDETTTTLKELVAETEGITGSTVKVNYPYWLTDAEGNAYTHGAKGSEFIEAFDLKNGEGDTTFVVNYSKTEYSGIVFLSEGEDIPGAILCTSPNTAVRSSMGKAAYFTEDVKLVTLQPGTYKIRAVLFDTNKVSDYVCTLTKGEGEENEIYLSAVSINFSEVESDEFTITKPTEIILKAAGNENQGIDVIMIYGVQDPNASAGKLGDVNHDDAIDVTDAVLIIDDILMKNPANYDASLADVNNDSYIDVTDVVMVIDAILGKIELSRGAEPIDRSAYTAFQMDLTIPAGYVLESVSLTEIAKNSHSLAYAMLPDGRCRVVVCSMNNEALPGAWDEVISLNLRGKGDAQMTIDRAVFVTIDGERHELMMNPTSIAQISNLNTQTSNLYDLQGRKVGENAKGILLENGKKVVKK